MIHIQLFGSLSVQHAMPDGNINPLTLTTKVGDILAFLSLFRGRYFSRDELVSEIWEDNYGKEVSQGAFNTTLWRLRKKIEKKYYRAGELFRRDCRGFLCFRKEADVYLDIEEFKRKACQSTTNRVDKLTQTQVNSLCESVELYSADILGNFTAEWALREREKIRRVYFNVLRKLIEYYRFQKDYRSSIRYAQLILDNEPLREDVHRELMELYELSGQRAMALRQFEECRNLLRKELAIPPMRQTMQLYHQIAEHALHPEHKLKTESDELPIETFNVLEQLPPELTDQFPVDTVGPSTDSSPGKLINQARKHIALADERLRKTIKHFNK
ncbi:AfsR/SARP family transcriptional regulator [Aliikangiella coralliicola]|uniref:Response regulator receiver protein n=1 Tax=Aliikangiella coralliicola TaxID=2592383 RepID=A0A545U922_9GAMM|nr:BTAD domain-containing putative transcriptional regulator [Aliikangiella coralliicola]TQV85968.1 response regulator receiver protein [Aliikangiella coralliicola]